MNLRSAGTAVAFRGKKKETQVFSDTHLYRYADGRVIALFVCSDDQPQGVADYECHQRDPNKNGTPLVLLHHVRRGPSPS